MKRINWRKYKFHCSSLPCLMTASRTKDPLSETAKANLREIWIKEKFNRENYGRVNKFTSKGLEVEQDSLDIVTRIIGKGFLAKNRETLTNNYLIGTPDVVAPFLLDIKSSWDIWTFAEVEERKAVKDYYWQLFGYAWMLKKKSAKLAYALVNTPEQIKTDELYRLNFKIAPEEVEKAEINYVFDDIPEKKRVKVFNLHFKREEILQVMEKLDAAREYLRTLDL